MHLNEVEQNEQLTPFSVFLESFKDSMNHVFHTRENIDEFSLRRGIPPFVLREIMNTNPLTAAIPETYGGRGGLVPECLAILEAASYESLALSLTIGINLALFLIPVAKYGDEEVRISVFKDFIEDKKMGGLMITEPDYGSDALHMQTSYTHKDGYYHLKGTKHWAGLTGWADYWLLTARRQTKSGDLMRDIDFFVCNVNAPNQHIVVDEYFHNLGLYMIPYGRNLIDVKIPEVQKLNPSTNGVGMMLDVLNRSRLMMPGMGMGFVKRILDEAIQHTLQRNIGRNTLSEYDQVQHRLSRIQGAFTILSAMCTYSSKHAEPEKDVSGKGLEANILKTVNTDLMQESAQSLLQLVGAKGYKIDHIAGRGIIDSRPFQIFEGSNDILYVQIAEAVMKMMRKKKEPNLLAFLKTYPLSDRAYDHVKDLVNFKPDPRMSQRKQVKLGRAIAYVFSIGLLMELEDGGFRKDLIDGARIMLRQDITKMISSYRFENETTVIENYGDNSSWFDSIR